jgi:membrane associated rhomboid family serine protease
MGLVAICVLVFLYSGTLSGDALNQFTLDFALIPYRLHNANLYEQFVHTPAWLTLITSMFLHAGYVHLIVNMIVLVSFGIMVERLLGVPKFLLLYFVAGIAGGLLHTFVEPASRIPVVGASGAISGVLAGAFIADPYQKIILVIIPMPFWLAMGVLVVAHIVFVITGWLPGVAWWAHLGGLTAGALVYLAFRGPRLRPGPFT